MSGFSPEWLALREPVDHRSRCPRIAAKLSDHFAGLDAVSVVDLGCGTGSNLRGSCALLPKEQHWTLVDYDPRLLEAAARRLAEWADVSTSHGDRVEIEKFGRRMTVRFEQADLNRELDAALGEAPGLVTAAAFFDLASPEFIGRLVPAVAARKAAFCTVLTYNGGQSWAPPHEADQVLLDAFHRHQRSDKGFGPSAGPAAAVALGTTFLAAGYKVCEGDSPWLLDGKDQRLITDLAAGFAEAAKEEGSVDPASIGRWAAVSRTGAVVGHTDTLALPPAAGTA